MSVSDEIQESAACRMTYEHLFFMWWWINFRSHLPHCKRTRFSFSVVDGNWSMLIMKMMTMRLMRKNSFRRFSFSKFQTMPTNRFFARQPVTARNCRAENFFLINNSILMNCYKLHFNCCSSRNKWLTAAIYRQICQAIRLNFHATIDQSPIMVILLSLHFLGSVVFA